MTADADEVHRALLQAMGIAPYRYINDLVWVWDRSRSGYYSEAEAWTALCKCRPLDFNLIHEAEEKLLTTDKLWFHYQQLFQYKLLTSEPTFREIRHACPVVLGECILKAIIPLDKRH